MNSMKIKDKLKNISKNKNIDFNILLKFYVFDRFIARLSVSKYKDNFIIKGGFLLSKLFGLENRSTMDIDSMVNKTDFTKDNILKMIKEISKIDLGDNVIFTIKDVSLIREEDVYGGYRVNLIFEFENIREILKLDIATGDLITPSAITFKYKTLFDEEIKVWAYNIETILAEKIETILSKAEASSRMKDYYDIYLIYNRSIDNINKTDFRNAVINTFKKRNFDKDLLETFAIIKESKIIRNRWNAYAKKYDYAKDITFDEIISCIEKFVMLIVVVNS